MNMIRKYTMEIYILMPVLQWGFTKLTKSENMGVILKPPF